MLPRTKDEWRERIARVNAEAEAELLPHLPTYPVRLERDGRLVTATPDHRLSGKVVLYFHGGGFVYFGGALVDYWTAAEALRMRVTHVGVDYRLAPDHPHPAAVEDGVTAYRALLTRHDPKDIAVFGVSAGGFIAVATLLRGLPAPSCLMLDAPVMDLACSGESYRFDPTNSVRETAPLYADPPLTLLDQDFSGFPPTFLMAGERDILLSDTLALQDRLDRAGVDTTLHVIPGAPHGGLGAKAQPDMEARGKRLIFLLNR